MAVLAAAAAATLTPLSPFRYPSGNHFTYHPIPVIGFSSTTSSLPHPLRCLSRSTRPLLEQPRRLNSAALLASGVGFAIAATGYALPITALAVLSSFEEPKNALSLPTWAIHVSSVVEWVIAMALVWEYGEKSGLSTWKGLSWGMVPLLGGAMCACTWHFFYNSESLEILVAMQGALTLVGNMTMCIAAFRIFKAYQRGSKNS